MDRSDRLRAAEFAAQLMVWLRVLRARRKTWISIALVGSLLGGAVAALQTPQYSAHASLEFVGLQAEALASAALVSRLAVLRSQSLRAASIDWLLDLSHGPEEPGWPQAVRAAADGIDIDLAANSSIVEIFCWAPTPRSAAAVANALADAFVARDLKDQLEAARQRDERVRRQLAGVSDAERILDLIQASGPAPYLRILDRAAVPLVAFGPDATTGALAGLLLGLCGGCLFVGVRHHLDRSFKQPGDASRALGLRELGIVPDSAYEPGLDRMTPAGVAAPRPPSAEKSCIESRPSWLAECVRGVRASLLAGADSHRVLTVTSATRGEGKTTVAANLAGSFAESGRRTLLVDADLRNPRLCVLFGVSNSEGLADLLQDQQREPSELFVEVAPNLWLLPAGVAMHGGPGLLHAQLTHEFFNWLRPRFDIVIVDSPPTLAGSDARALAAIADGTVLVVRAGATGPATAIQAKSVLESDGVHLLGVVLNSWDPRVYGLTGAQDHAAAHPKRAVA
jgi:capsular exopolysaccharide synthesis family protein